MKILKTPKTSLALMALFLGLTVSMTGYAQKANFAGNFKLNEGKSTMGEGRMRPAFQLTVTQDINTLSVDRKIVGFNGEERIQSEKFSLDGKVSENTGFMNRVSKSTANWSADQETLTINTTSVFTRDGQSTEITSTEVWSISADGAVLTIELTRETPMGETKLKLVYDKAK